MEYRSRHTLVVVLILAGILCVGGLFTYFVYLSPTGIKAHQNADLTRITNESAATYTTLDGVSVELGAHNDKVMIVNVWASWSPYTEIDHQTLSRISDRFRDTVSVLAINRKETKETAHAYLETIGRETGIEYIIDETDHFFSSVGGYAMPETIVFDLVGNVRFHKRGPINEGELEEALDSILGQK